MLFPEQHHWRRITRDFHRLWNFPNCLGNRKYVAIQAPSSGWMMDVEAEAYRTLARSSIRGTLDLPEDAPLPGAEDLQLVPHVFVGDEVFPLKRRLFLP